MKIETLCLDAGGVLVFPNWNRISDVLARHGVEVGADRLATAEPHAKRALDVDTTIRATNDRQRGWVYFNLVLEQAGVALSEATDQALAELHGYHTQSNLWELVPSDVPAALERLRRLVSRLVVVSNANGTLRDHLRRVGLEAFFDVVLDSADEGVEKPDPRLFEIALGRAGGLAETTLHVGDFYHVDVIGARRAGLFAILLDPANLYADVNCPRVTSLGGVADLLDSFRAEPTEPGLRPRAT